jgi:AbrB family looped-hinge helix DNA binding protein
MDEQISVKVSRRYQVAVPKQARKRLKIQSGDRLLVDIQDGMIILMPMKHRYTDALAGLHKEIWQDLDAKKIVDGERGEWEA